MSQRQQILAVYHQLISRGWSADQAIRELQEAISNPGNYMMHDKDGNVIIDGESLKTDADTDEVMNFTKDTEETRRNLEAKERAEHFERMKEAVEHRERQDRIRNELIDEQEPGQVLFELSVNDIDWNELDDESKSAWAEEEAKEQKEPGQEYYEQSKHFRDTSKPWSSLNSETKHAWKIYGRKNTELELELSSEETRQAWKELIDHQDATRDSRDQELEMSEEGLREKPPHDPDTAPTWTEVRGMTSFYYICPRCGAMIPGTGPKLPGPDGKERTPKEQHENWHKSQLIDWFDDNE